MSDEFNPAALAIDFDRLLAALRRQAGIFAGVCMLAILVGAVWILTSVPRYTASTFVLLDNKRVRPVEEAYGVNTPVGDASSSIIESQIEVLKSENVAVSVIQKVQSSDPDLNVQSLPKGDVITRLRHGILRVLGLADQTGSAGGEEDGKKARLHYAADLLRWNTDIRRVPRTMVLEISYRSPDPVKAARIANAFAEAYLADQLTAKYEATKRASDWLEQRLGEIKQKAVAGDLAVQKYKEDHGLIGSGGKLVNEQQLNEINSQLILARADTARAQARFDSIEAIIRGHQTEAVVSEAIGNQIISQLRSKYLDASKRESEISAKLGSNHVLAANLRDEMHEYERLMFGELGRLAESYRSDLEIAKSKEESLTASLQKSERLNATEYKILVGLHELEREGEAYRILYQSYLQRYHEALQQQTFPIIDARIITSASPPLKPSHPKKLLILLLCLVAGMLVSIGIAVYREHRERGFGSEEQVKNDLGVECLGILPSLPQSAGLVVNGQAYGSEGSNPRSSVGALRFALTKPKPGSAATSSGILSFAQDNPRSGFAETLFAVKLAADVKLADKTSKIIGVISSLPGEGKSVFAKNLSSILAKQNFRVLLVDGDLRAQTLTRWLAPKACVGLVEAAIKRQPLEGLLTVEKSSGLSILPTVLHARPSNTSEFLASAAMKDLLERACSHFDYIIIDLPPLGPVVDARAIAPNIGAFVLVVEWRRTPRKVVRNILSAEGELYQKCLGAVINKVNIREIKLFENYGSRYFYYRDYEDSYYWNEREAPVPGEEVLSGTPKGPCLNSNGIGNDAHT